MLTPYEADFGNTLYGSPDQRATNKRACPTAHHFNWLCGKLNCDTGTGGDWPDSSSLTSAISRTLLAWARPISLASSSIRTYQPSTMLYLVALENLLILLSRTLFRS
jgi:hypothetical protein